MLRVVLFFVMILSPGCGTKDDAPDTPPADCAGGYACPEGVSGCNYYRDPERPECELACAEGRCCLYNDYYGWQPLVLDCAHPEVDAAPGPVDAMPPDS